jgi:hypothetical protein
LTRSAAGHSGRGAPSGYCPGGEESNGSAAPVGQNARAIRPIRRKPIMVVTAARISIVYRVILQSYFISVYQMKTLVLYVFHQYNQRVKYFLENAIFKAEDVDFLIICNSMDLQFAHPDYVKVFRRNNTGFDFGGWADALCKDDTYTHYDRFIFVNSSVMGPYLTDSEKQRRWTDVFLEGLKSNVRLYGPTINAMINYPVRNYHVQSYAFCMDREVLTYLLNETGVFSQHTSFNDAIFKGEVPMSTYVLKKGWNIGSGLKCYAGIDFTKPLAPSIVLYDDIMYPQFLNKHYTKEDVMFIKGNRFGIA